MAAMPKCFSPNHPNGGFLFKILPRVRDNKKKAHDQHEHDEELGMAILCFKMNV